MRAAAGSAASPHASPSPSRSPPHPSAASMARALASGSAEDAKAAGNEYYKAGRFADALQLYDRAVALAPTRAHYRANRAAALSALNRVADAVADCEEALRLDGSYARGRQRLSGLYLRLGRVEDARAQLAEMAEGEAAEERARLERVEGCVARCEQSVRAGDWQGAVVEADGALRDGADLAPQCLALFTSLHPPPPSPPSSPFPTPPFPHPHLSLSPPPAVAVEGAQLQASRAPLRGGGRADVSEGGADSAVGVSGGRGGGRGARAGGESGGGRHGGRGRQALAAARQVCGGLEPGG
ncbi:unnamed protein product, partial [Closterium sp. NIES-53]